MAGYIIKGITTDTTTCDCCGRRGLKCTVALAAIDADNMQGEVAYYGTGCAATILGFSNYKTLNAARSAENRKTEAREHAREIIAWYGIFEGAPVRLQSAAYFGRNPHMRNQGVKATAEITRMLSEARTALAA